MTYTALLALAILRDDFSKLDRPGLITLLRACQREDGRFVSRMIHLRVPYFFKLYDYTQRWGEWSTDPLLRVCNKRYAKRLVWNWCGTCKDIHCILQSKSFCCSLPLQCVTEFNRHMKVDTVKHLSARLKVCDLGLKLSLWLITFATYRRNDLYRNSFSLSCTFKRREWPSHTYRESPDNSVASQQPGCYKRRRCSIRWVFRAHWKDRRQLLLFLVWCRTEGNFYISFVIHWLAKKKPIRFWNKTI